MVNDILGQYRGAGPLSRADVLQLIDTGGSEGGAQVRAQPRTAVCQACQLEASKVQEFNSACCRAGQGGQGIPSFLRVTVVHLQSYVSLADG